MPLEDQGRNKPPKRTETLPDKRSSSYLSPWTVMILRDLGKAFSLKISPIIVFGIGLFLILYTIASVIIFKCYFDEVSANRAQSIEIERLRQDIDDSRKALYRSRQHMTLLEDHIKDQQGGREKRRKPRVSEGKFEPKSEGPKKISPEEVSPERISPESISRNEPSPADAGDSAGEAYEVHQEPVAVIRDLTIEPEETELTVAFRLVKVGPDMETFTGYVHIIAINKGQDPPQLWSYPKVELQNGMPIDYKQGRLFTIRHFKTIRGEYFFDSKAIYPSSVKVLVFNESGEMVLEKEFDVKAPAQRISGSTP